MLAEPLGRTRPRFQGDRNFLLVYVKHLRKYPMRALPFHTTLAVIAAATLVACGGGGGSEAGSSTAQSAVYSGPISGLGSVTVNGVRFSSIGATLSDDDGAGLRSDDLKLGQTVRVSGTSDDATGQGNATAVVVQRGLQGAVSGLNTASGSFTLLGQVVTTNASTTYEGVTGLAGLADGNTVEVYGAVQPTGGILATRVERKTIAGVSVRGRVATLNTTAKTFTVGTLLVNYAGATVTGTLANGAVVKVKAANAPVANTLAASTVKLSDDGAAYTSAGAASIKIKGLADAAPVAGKLTVSGTPVDIGNATLKGSTVVTAGQLLEVKGTWNGTTLVAREVEFEGARDAQVGGRNELYGAVSSFTSVSNFVVNGVTVDASAVTGLNAAQLGVGTYVEIKGNVVGNVLKATKVEFKSANPSGGFIEQSGVVSGFVSVSDFRINSLRVDASTASFEKGSAVNLVNGAFVEIKGTQNASGIFKATKVEFQSRSGS